MENPNADEPGTEVIRARLRRKHIGRLIIDRFGCCLPAGEVALPYLLSVGECCGVLARGRKSGPSPASIAELLAIWCASWAPQATDADIQTTSLSVAKLDGWKPNDDHVGERLHLSNSDRDRLKITTIGCFDLDPAAREDDRIAKKRARDKERSRIKRAADGSVPRAQYLAANNASRSQPWKEEGISRPTYYRRKKERRAGPLP